MLTNFEELKRQGLKKLSLSGEGIKSTKDWKEAAKFISQGAITDLSIAQCQFNNSDLKNIVKSFSLLSVLDLSGNFIGSNGCSTLAKYIRSNSTIKELNISSCKLLDVWIECVKICGSYNDEGFSKLIAGMASAPNLTIVDVSSNYLGGLSGSGHSTSSRSLVLTMPTKLDYGRKIATLLSDLTKNSNSIASLNIEPNGFQDNRDILDILQSHVGRSYVCKSLCGPAVQSFINETYDSFCFSGRCLTPFGAWLVGSHISLLSIVARLDLSDNLEVSLLHDVIDFCSYLNY